MDFQTLEYAREDRVAVVTLSRPAKRNAYTPEMGEEIVAAFERARADDGVRALILTGAGRGFCAGVDLAHFEAHMAGQAPDSGPVLGEEAFVRDWPLQLLEYPKPVIAAINGAAFGVGVTMTLGCDLRLAACGARLGLNFASLGVLPGLGSTHLLPQLVGRPKALELVLSAAVVSAEEAARIGLVHAAVPGDELMQRARATARALAECRPEVLTAAKRALRHGSSSEMAGAMQREQQLSAALRTGGAMP